MNKLKVDQKITVEEKIFRVNGFDEYMLTNIYGQNKKWTSYTLIDVTDDKHKIWLGHGIVKDYFVKMWLISEKNFKKNTKNIFLNGNFTGIANITFSGNQGYSLPVSEVIWYDKTTNAYDFLVIERFLEMHGENITPLESYYHAIKILKNFTI